MEGRIEVTPYVLDTSVVIKWFSESGEDDLGNALRLRQRILEGAFPVAVPSLLFYELCNALRLNPKFDAREVKEAATSVLDMGFSIRDVTAELLERAVDLAFARGITVYDACFLALAEAEGATLVTADATFLAQLKGSKHAVPLSKLRPDRTRP